MRPMRRMPGANDGNKQKAKNKAFNRGQNELADRNVIQTRCLGDVTYIWAIAAEQAEAVPALRAHDDNSLDVAEISQKVWPLPRLSDMRTILRVCVPSRRFSLAVSGGTYRDIPGHCPFMSRMSLELSVII